MLFRTLPTLSLTVIDLIVLLLYTGNLAVPFTEPTFSSFLGCDGTFSCGNIHNLTYPFTDGDRPDHCGTPEFRLTCMNNVYPELAVDSLNYRVLEANLTDKTLILARSDFWNNTCPSMFVNSTLDSSNFDSGSNKNVDLTIFLGCSWSSMFIQPPFFCDVGGVDLTESYFLISEVPIDPVAIRMLICICDSRIFSPPGV